MDKQKLITYALTMQLITVNLLSCAASSVFNLQGIPPDPRNKILKKLIPLILKDPYLWKENEYGVIAYDTTLPNIHANLISSKRKTERFMQKLWSEHKCHPNDRAEDITNTHIIMLNKIAVYSKITPTLQIAALLRCKLEYRDYFIPHLENEITFAQNQADQNTYIQELQKLITYVNHDLIPRTDELIRSLEANKDHSKAFKRLFKEN